MGRHLTVATVLEVNRVSSDVAFIELVEVDVRNSAGTLIETLRFCRNSENLVYNGQLYQAADFAMNIKQSAGEETTVSMNTFDPTGVLLGYMEQYDGGVGFPVRLHVVNTARLTDPPEISETFEVIGASAKGYNVSFQLGAENPLRRRFPHGLQYRDRCRFVFRGTRCKYAGPLATCDYTFDGTNGCAAHANQQNFGGFRGLGSL